jgi:hypothetical protein
MNSLAFVRSPLTTTSLRSQVGLVATERVAREEVSNMATNSFQVILSTDGKHTVIATTEEFRMTAQAEEWAKTTYDKIAERYGLKGAVKPNGAQQAEEAPMCGVHHVAMVQVNGRKGPFWSCHERNSDGSFCNYRPAR